LDPLTEDGSGLLLGLGRLREPSDFMPKGRASVARDLRRASFVAELQPDQQEDPARDDAADKQQLERSPVRGLFASFQATKKRSR
jgi:hypothetical protein